MADWHGEALDEIGALKPYYVAKHGWQPEVAESEEAIDLFVRLRAAASRTRRSCCGCATCPTGSEAGRREAFVNPDDRDRRGPEVLAAGGQSASTRSISTTAR